MMTDAEFEALTEEYRDRNRRWMWKLGLQWWETTLEFYRSGIPGIESNAAAMVTHRWEYEFATIRVNVGLWASLDEAGRESSIVHELLHMVLAPVTDGKRKRHEERAVTQLTRALLGRMRVPWEMEEEGGAEGTSVSTGGDGDSTPQGDATSEAD